MKLNYFATICATITLTAHALPIPVNVNVLGAAAALALAVPTTGFLARNPHMPAPVGQQRAAPLSRLSSVDNKGKLSGEIIGHDKNDENKPDLLGPNEGMGDNNGKQEEPSKAMREAFGGCAGFFARENAINKPHRDAQASRARERARKNALNE